jgi:hypothetical protein
METETIKENEKERITLEYTAKGYANWTISLKETNITQSTLERLKTLDDEMRAKWQINVMVGAA